MRDSAFGFGMSTEYDSFFTIGKTTKFEEIHEVAQDAVFISEFNLSRLGTLHERKVYSLFNLLSDLGGVAELLIIIFGVLVFPFSEFSFNISRILPSIIWNPLSASKIQVPLES